jgi:uncharacterized protein YndB with AHSA1/START domain
MSLSGSPLPAIDPVIVTARVKRNIEDAFDLYTREVSSWWPLDRFSFGGDQALSLHFEPYVGGRFFERFRDGREHTTGRILAWEPPRRFVYTWKHDDWSADTEIEVRFVAEADDLTRLEIEHRAWERLGEAGPENRDGYANGWPTVISCFADYAGKA